MAIVKEKIKLTLPEGITQQGDISVSGRKATVTLNAVTAGTKNIQVSYDGGEAVSEEITVNEVVTFTELTVSGTNHEVDDTITVTATFDKTPTLSQFSIDPVDGLQETQSKQISGSTITVQYKITSEGQKNIVAHYNDTQKNKQITASKVTISTVLADPDTVNEGETVEVSINFNEFA